MTENNKKILVGVKQIVGYLEMSPPTFYKLLKKGLPANLIDGKWYAHKENLDEYFKLVTRKPPAEFPIEEEA